MSYLSSATAAAAAVVDDADDDQVKRCNGMSVVVAQKFKEHYHEKCEYNRSFACLPSDHSHEFNLSLDRQSDERILTSGGIVGGGSGSGGNGATTKYFIVLVFRKIKKIPCATHNDHVE